jgi:putative transposase
VKRSGDRGSYKCWQNLGQPGDTVFVTTTVLDFVEAFREPRLAGAVVRELLLAHSRYGAALHAFVVMPEHLHFVTGLPAEMDVSTFVQRFKSLSARHLRPMLPPDIEAAFGAQRGLGSRTFWQRSFRSVVLEGDAFVRQKAEYIHTNPVRRGLCEVPEQYPWSSARMHEAGLYTSERGLLFEESPKRNPPQQAAEG